MSKNSEADEDISHFLLYFWKKWKAAHLRIIATNKLTLDLEFKNWNEQTNQ